MNLVFSRPRLSRWFLATSLVVSATLTAQAQNSTVCTTNFYNITGSSFRDIRESIARARPWKDAFDGDTHWDVRWKFQYQARPGGCSITSYSVTTKIVITLPRWTPPADVDPGVKEQWTRYYTNLVQHEWGHARLGAAAGDEVAKRISEVPAQSECDAMTKLIDEKAGHTVDGYRAREKEYDRRTNHGMNPSGAR